jgi:dihydrodipicolinate synthase/N-acetylneuraminate lyase
VVPQFDRQWVLHNDPKFIRRLRRPLKRNNIRTSIMKDLCTIEGIRGLIFSGPLERAYNYQKAVRTRPEFRIYDGEESRFLSHPSMSGVVSIGANLAPKAWQRIAESTINPGSDRGEYPDRLQQIWETGRYVSDLMRLYQQNPVPLIKKRLSEMGIIEGPAGMAETKEMGPYALELRRLMEQQGSP